MIELSKPNENETENEYIARMIEEHKDSHRIPAIIAAARANFN